MRGAPGQHLLDKYQEGLEAVQHRHGVTLSEIRWIPGHDSIAGNERADLRQKGLLTVTQASWQLPNCAEAWSQSADQLNDRHTSRGLRQGNQPLHKVPRCQRLRRIDLSMPL